MSTGLIALLDDVAALAKVAAASLDDVPAHVAKAGAKAAGVVIDDAAVTPRYVTGFPASREAAVVGRIALGSLRNKLLFLLPGALALGLFAPWAVTPLLMGGGAFLCYEGAEKILEALRPHAAPPHAAKAGQGDGRALEDRKVAGAIQTDLILSAEIMAITLAAVPDAPLWEQAVVLAVVGLGLTVAVYGAVALIVKADDAGVALARNDRPASTLLGFRAAAPDTAPSGADRALRPAVRGFGRGLVVGMPVLLRVLAVVGTAAMLWVGGGILLHGLEEYGLGAPGHALHGWADAASAAVPAALGGTVAWLVVAAGSGVLGLVAGAVLIPVVEHVLAPARAWLGRAFGGRTARRTA